MSIKVPIDAFAANPLSVMFGPNTVADGKGFSIPDIVVGVVVLYFFARFCVRKLPGLVGRYSPFGVIALGWLASALAAGVVFALTFAFILPAVMSVVNGALGAFGNPVLGFTAEHYQAVWVDNQFYRNFINSLIVTTGVVTISLTVGTLAGYGLARSGSNIAFWLLIAALIFRSLPHSVLVAGYLPVFINSAEILSPILGENAPTLYGQPLAVIAVLVSINQPFTIWMLRSFFQNIPADLDEAARVDGCTHFQAFR